MTGLPRIIQRTPFIFYGLAILFFVASWLLTLNEINVTMGYGEPTNPAITHAKLRGLYEAAREAIYIAANGVLAHILVAIWRNGAARTGAEGTRD